MFYSLFPHQHLSEADRQIYIPQESSIREHRRHLFGVYPAVPQPTGVTKNFSSEYSLAYWVNLKTANLILRSHSIARIAYDSPCNPSPLTPFTPPTHCRPHEQQHHNALSPNTKIASFWISLHVTFVHFRFLASALRNKKIALAINQPIIIRVDLMTSVFCMNSSIITKLKPRKGELTINSPHKITYFLCCFLIRANSSAGNVA